MRSCAIIHPLHLELETALSFTCRSWQNPQAHSWSTLFEHERREYLSSRHRGEPWSESSAALTHSLSSSLPNLPFLDSP
jgi:hypothetical protein